MGNLPKRSHPPWCLRGPDCATAPDCAAWHSSRLTRVPAAEHPCVDVAVGRWQLEPAETRRAGNTGPAAVLAGGVLLEFRLGDDVDQWPIDGAQAIALAHLIPRLPPGDAVPRRRWAA